MIGKLIGKVLGTGIGETVSTVAGAFIPNAEARSQRDASDKTSARDQYGAEFAYRGNRTWIDALADGLNRLVRPAFALGVLGIFAATPIWPAAMAKTFTAWAALPWEAWSVLGIIVSFYFAGRMQEKKHRHSASLTASAAALQKLADAPPPPPGQNPAVQDFLDGDAAERPE